MGTFKQIPIKHVLITGASSGIGEALALAYAAPGVRLSLSGRDLARVAAVGEACRRKGAATDSTVMDAADHSAMVEWIRACDQVEPLDLVIANAGISGGLGESMEVTRRIFSVNIDGVANTVLPAIEIFRKRGCGQLAIVSSLAGFRGIGGSPAYCASKAAVKVWGEGLRSALAAENIGVSVICPGFVVSRMTDVNKFPMPFLMSTAKAAGIIQRGLAANKGRIAFPWPMLFGVWLLATIPDAWAGFLGRILPKKED